MDLICNQTSVASMRNSLSILPATYEKAYEMTFNRILKQPDTIVDLSKRVLNWVLHAKRPLTMQELQHAIAIKSHCKSIDPESLESPKVILSSCLGMVSLSKVDGRVHIIHATARQFLESNEQLLSERPQYDIARSCLRYLVFDELSSGPCELVEDLQQRLIRMPFLDYCARAWGHHVRQFQKSLWNDITDVLCVGTFCEASWQVLRYRQSLDRVVSADIFKLQPMNPHALHVAAFWGFAGFIERSSWGNHDPHYKNFSPVDSHGWTPLHWAASMGNEESVATLVGLGVDIDKPDSNGWTPLTFAVVKGHYNIVKILLKCGAQRSATDVMGFSIEQWALVSSHGDIHRLLQEPLETAPPNTTAEPRISHEWSVRKRDSKVSMSELELETSPQALEEILHECSKQFEEAGTVGERPDFIGVETRPQLWGTLIKMDSFYWELDQVHVGLNTSLRKQIIELAILQGNLSVIKLVVESDSRVSKEIPRGALGKYGRTCLHTAAYCTDPGIAIYLLRSGADITVRDEMNRTPLHLAAAYGSPGVVRVMAEAPNCDINARDKLGRTPLHWCLALGGWKFNQNRGEENVEIFRLLISKGATVTAVDANGNTSLHYGTVLKDEHVILLVLEHGMKLWQTNNHGETALDSLVDDDFYYRWGGRYNDIWDRPYGVRKFEWYPPEEQTISAVRTIRPHITTKMTIPAKMKELLDKLNMQVNLEQIQSDE
jgi:ankyrin repeat protein